MAKKKKEEIKEAPKVEEPPHVCEVCGEQSVIREDDGHRYCLKHHEYWCKFLTHDKIMAVK